MQKVASLIGEGVGEDIIIFIGGRYNGFTSDIAYLEEKYSITEYENVGKITSENILDFSARPTEQDLLNMAI